MRGGGRKEGRGREGEEESAKCAELVAEDAL